MEKHHIYLILLLSLSLSGTLVYAQQKGQILIPQIDNETWRISGDPDLGKYSDPKQQSVDFAVWQAADKTWQLWSCIRGTRCGGMTRLFYRWQGAALTDSSWKPMGIAMQADTSFGETAGGLQAPFVTKIGIEYFMFYGGWNAICLAKGLDGKTFARQLLPNNNRSTMFTEGFKNNTRDPMVIHSGKLYYVYYTANGKNGFDYVRTTKDFKAWSPSKIVACGGSAGNGPWSAECPFVYFHKPSGYYYLFRTQFYGKSAKTSVYRSKNLMDFGINDDKYLVTTLPIAAPEIIEYNGKVYIAALLASLKGIFIAKLNFIPKPGM